MRRHFDNPEEAWAEAERADTVVTYQAYLDGHSEGSQVGQAREPRVALSALLRVGHAEHVADENGLLELYFVCDGLKAEMASLAKKGVECSEVQEARWGSTTKMRLPGGGEVGLYQPKHPTAAELKSS